MPHHRTSPRKRSAKISGEPPRSGLARHFWAALRMSIVAVPVLGMLMASSSATGCIVDEHAASSGGNGGAGGNGSGAGATTSTSTSTGPPGAFTMMSWNLETYPLAPQTPDRVREIINARQPDIIGIQEIDTVTAFNQLAASLPDYDAILNDDPGNFLRVALLTRKGRVEVSEVATLFKSDWFEFPRSPLKAKLKVGDFDFIVMVLHLKAKIDSESTERRRLASQKLDEWTTAFRANNPEQDIAFIGDLNDEIDDNNPNNVFLPFLNQPETYQFLTQPLASNDYSYIPFQGLIDHILVTTDMLDEYGAAGVTEVLHLENQYPDYEDVVSDHLPILSTFAATPGAGQ